MAEIFYKILTNDNFWSLKRNDSVLWKIDKGNNNKTFSASNQRTVDVQRGQLVALVTFLNFHHQIATIRRHTAASFLSE